MISSEIQNSQLIEKMNQEIIEEYMDHLKEKSFPCVAAHEAAIKNTIRCYVADHIACPHNDLQILNFLYAFVDEYRTVEEGYHSSAIIFKNPRILSEEMFDMFLWQRLQALADLDATNYPYDSRVSSNTNSPHFSFSLKSEAFYIIGLHESSSRKARQFKYPALVFNPHAQFQKLREDNHYQKMQRIVRSRDVLYSGSVNPMLADFGTSPEVFQYSGREYEATWSCPLKLKHADTTDHPST